MHTPRLLSIALTATAVAGDTLNTWLSDMCTDADEFYVSPLELGTCYHFDQAQSYILSMDDPNVYNLYSGDGCAQYVGQVPLSGSCLMVGEATAIMNIGPQPAKRLRFAREPVTTTQEQEDPISAPVVERRLEGATYQCPNIPSGAAYFMVLTQSSATTEETFPTDETTIANDFLASFNAAYQNPAGQTEVMSSTPLGGIMEDVQVTYTATEGVVQEIQDQDMRALIGDLMDFRDRERSPVRFIVGLYTGVPGNVGGLVGRFDWNGD